MPCSLIDPNALSLARQILLAINAVLPPSSSTGSASSNSSPTPAVRTHADAEYRSTCLRHALRTLTLLSSRDGSNLPSTSATHPFGTPFVRAHGQHSPSSGSNSDYSISGGSGSSGNANITTTTTAGASSPSSSVAGVDILADPALLSALFKLVSELSASAKAGNGSSSDARGGSVAHTKRNRWKLDPERLSEALLAVRALLRERTRSILFRLVHAGLGLFFFLVGTAISESFLRTSQLTTN